MMTDSTSLTADVLKMLLPVLQAVQEEFGKMPNSEELVEKVSNKFCATCQAPPIQDFEFALQKNFSGLEVCTALFSPLEEQIAYYARVWSLSLSISETHNLKKTSSLMLTLVYLVHRKRFCFLRELILSDGLVALMPMLNSDNLYDRGQALEIFLGITDCDSYDWFQPPSTHSDRLIHSKMLDLANYPLFLDSLIANRSHSYPGGSFRALQLLAFWLSWVRALYTKDQLLLLSSKLLRELEAWSQRPIDVDNGVIEEEIKLAQTVFDDFRQAGTFENASHTSNTVSGIHLSDAAISQAYESVALADLENQKIIQEEVEPAPAQSDIDHALLLKEQGNELFRQCKYADALEKYQSDLTVVKQLSFSSEHNTLLVLLYTNIANTLWKSLTNQPQSESDDRDKVLLDIEYNCEQALILQPQHAKALYRLLMTKIDRGDLQAAYQRAEHFIQDLCTVTSIKQRSSSMSGDVKEEIERFRKLQRKCIAKALLKQDSPPIVPHEWGLTQQKLQILSLVLKQNQLQHLLPPPSNICTIASDEIAPKKKYADRRIHLDEQEEVALETKLPPAVNQMLNQLFDDHDVQLPQSSKKPKKKASDTNSIASLSSNTVNKVSSSDRKKILVLKKIAADLAALTLRAKEDEDLTIKQERTRLLMLAKDSLISVLLEKGLLLKDLYGSGIDEHDLLLLFSFVINTSNADIDLIRKILQQIPVCDRIKSVVFLFNMEFGQVRQQVLDKIAADENDALVDKDSLNAVRLLLL